MPTHTPFKVSFCAIFERGTAIMDGCPLTVFEDGKEQIIPEFPKKITQGGGNISDLGGCFHEIKYFVDCLDSGKDFKTVTLQTSRQSLSATLQEIEAMRLHSK